ncbi:MAG TPA: DJ-1/PfpI family protein [Candidatus Babeliales bacterium]|nr:DJ-1/PfpI family protein [Candidatus Babeliales bacterium]
MEKHTLQEKSIILAVPSKKFSWYQYETVQKILEDAGAEIFIISDNSIEAVADNNNAITVDGALSIIDMSKYDGLFLIGGDATVACLNTPEMHKLIKDAEVMDIPYGAIGLGVRILAYAKALVGKEATGVNKDNALEDILEINGARYRKGSEARGENVIIDKRTITAHDTNDAKAFAQEIIKLLEKIDKGVTEDPLIKRG